MENLKQLMYKQLIVSCQAVDDEPLNDPLVISKMAYACTLGGARFLRVSQVEHIAAISRLVSVPMIGLIKRHYDNSEIFITPTIDEIDLLGTSNVKIIAMDATLRTRPKQSLEEMYAYARTRYPDIMLMADCSEKDDVVNAAKIGFDFIGTTMRGYTKKTANKTNVENDFAFVKAVIPLVKEAKLIVEGGIWSPEMAKQCLMIPGVFAIVVGSAITRPQEIVKHYLNTIG